jgi:hypothetical protein
MARKNLCERLRRYLAAVEGRTGGLQPPFLDGVPLVFIAAEYGMPAASGHTQALLRDRKLGSLEPYTLREAEERERQAKVLARQNEEREQQMLTRQTRGTVQ